MDDLSKQVASLEAEFKARFDANGWESFNKVSAAYVNDLYVETQRETHNRSSDAHALSTGQDVERASAKLDHKRHFKRKTTKYWFQIFGLLSSILSGITANWAFSDFDKDTRTQLPWITLVFLATITIALFGWGLQKESEP